MVKTVSEPIQTRAPYHRSQRWLAKGEEANEAIIKVFVSQNAIREVWEHANSDMENEVGGWLVGRWCWDKEGVEEFVAAESILPAGQVEHSGTHLTFTQNSQVAMLHALEQNFPERLVVGWYHTHPRMGLFLSGYDMWLHDHFFPYPWQVALVMDPHKLEGGFFIRDLDLKLHQKNYYGFYEMHKGQEQSVVPWQNLHLENETDQTVEKTIKEEAEP